MSDNNEAIPPFDDTWGGLGLTDLQGQSEDGDPAFFFDFLFSDTDQAALEGNINNNSNNIPDENASFQQPQSLMSEQPTPVQAPVSSAPQMTIPSNKKKPIVVNNNGKRPIDNNNKRPMDNNSKKRSRYQKKGQKMYELDENDFPNDPEMQKKIRQAKNARRQRVQTQDCIEDKDRVILELREEVKMLKNRLRQLEEEA